MTRPALPVQVTLVTAGQHDLVALAERCGATAGARCDRRTRHFVVAEVRPRSRDPFAPPTLLLTAPCCAACLARLGLTVAERPTRRVMADPTLRPDVVEAAAEAALEDRA